MRDRDYDYADDTRPTLAEYERSVWGAANVCEDCGGWMYKEGPVYVCAHCAAEVEEVEA